MKKYCKKSSYFKLCLTHWRINLYTVFLFFIILVFQTNSANAQWIRKADGLKPRSELGESIIYNSKLYTFVGFSDTLRHAEPTSEVYNPATNTWTYLASMPSNTAMTHADAILIDNTIWHIGGRVGQNPGPMSSIIWIYNITTNTWSKGPEVRNPATGNPMVIASSGSALLGRVLHIFGGFTPTACDDQDKYHLTLDVDTWLSNPSLPAKWENKLKPLPLKRNHLSAVVLGGKIYAIGGQSGHDCGSFDVAYCHVYNPSTDSWTQLPSPPTSRSHAEGSTFAIDGKIYVVGGQGGDGKATKYVTIFDPAGNNGIGTWIENTSLTLPYIYEGLSSKVIGTTFIISHGSQGSSKYPKKLTYTRTITRNPVYKLGFPSECLNLNDSSGSPIKGHTWLYTIDSTKTYTTSSSANWLVVSKNATGTATPNAVDIEVTANTAGLSPGTYNGTITATGSGGGTGYSPAMLCVKLTVQSNTPPVQYNLTVTPNGNGTITKSPNQATYSHGTSVILTATPAEGQEFTGWSGDATGTSNPVTIIMNSDKAITASFAQASPALISNIVATSGRVYTLGKLTVGTTVFTDRTYQVTTVPAFLNNAPFIKTPNDDKSNNSTLLLSFNLTQNATVYIAYDPRATALPAWMSGFQKLTSQVGFNDSKISYMQLYSKAFSAGKVSLGGNLASPAAGALDNYYVVAQPVSIQYSLTVTNSGSGTVTKSPNQATYTSGTNVILTATPATGQRFTGWSGDVTSTSNPVTIMMNSNKAVTANFAPISSALITNIVSATGNSYSLSELVVGATVYTDRTYQATTVPAFLNKAPLIKTPVADKGNKATEAFSFNLTQNATVYVAYDSRVKTLPAWMSGWQKLTSQVNLNDPKNSNMSLYSKAFSAGKVSLGGNLASPAAGALTNYFVAALPQQLQRPVNNTNNNGSLAKSIDNSLMQKSENEILDFKIYPNPVDGNKVLIEANNFSKEEIVTVTIQDVLGKIIKSLKILTDGQGTFSKDIYLNDVVKKGVYIIKIYGSSGSIQKKLIIN